MKSGRTRLFFASDIHGSDRCFRKWLNAARVYEVDALVFGGDIAGKVVVPIVHHGGDRYDAVIHGQPVEVSGHEELAQLQSYPMQAALDVRARRRLNCA